MPDEYEIDAVTWSDRSLGHDGLAAIGNRNGQWAISVGSAILRIEAGAKLFLIPISGVPVSVQVERLCGSAPRLRARTERGWSDHLLHLPELAGVEVID